MAVTTGKDTSTTSGGGKPSGGPGGPNGPNSGPSTGSGGQRGSSNNSTKSPNSNSAKSAASSSSGKTGTSSPASNTTSTPSNPTGGSLSAPARTAPSSGLTSRTPSQQNAIDKAKQNATQYGGAQVATRNATVNRSAPSAKVTDPSRTNTMSKSPMSGQGTSYRSPEAAQIGNKFAGNVVDLRGLNNYPNDPITEIDKAIGRLSRQERDFWDKYDRHLAAVLAGDQRNPQEIREAVERVKQDLRTKAKEREVSSLRNPIGNSPQSQLASSLGRISASGLTPNVPVGPSRQATSTIPSRNTPLGLSGSPLMGPQTGGITAPRSPMGGQGTTYSTPQEAAAANKSAVARSSLANDVARTLSNYSTPAANRMAQDPSVAGRAAQANQNYKTTSAPGGMASRTYSDPDVTAAQQANQPSFTDRITRGLQGLNDRLQTAFGAPEAGPNRGLDNPTVGEELAAATGDALSRIKAGAGTFIDNLMGQPLMGEQPAAPAGPMTVNSPILGPNRMFGPQNMSQAITGDYPKADFQKARTMNPVDRTPDQAVMDGLVSDPTNAMVTSRQAIANIQAAIAAAKNPAAPAGKQITDRVPQENTPMAFPGPANPNRGLAGLNPQPTAPTAPSMPDPRIAQMQEQFNRVAAGRNQPGKVAETSPAPPIGNDMSVEDIVKALTPQPTTPTRRGQITNPMYRDPMAQANAVRAAAAVAMGRRPQTAAPQPQNARQPTEITIPGYPERVAPSQEGDYDIGAQGGLGVQAYPGNVRTPPLNVPSSSSRAMRDAFYGGGPSPAVSSGTESLSPSQEGNYPPDDNFLQDDGQPQDLGELYNRGEYEKDRAIEGFKNLAGDLYNAIVNGDLRPYTGVENDKRPEKRPTPQSQAQAPQYNAQQQAELIALLMSLLQQQSAGTTQADLINSTFI